MARFQAALFISVCLHAMLSMSNFAGAQLEFPNKVARTVDVLEEIRPATEQLSVVSEEIPTKEVDQSYIVTTAKPKSTKHTWSKRPRFNRGRKRYHKMGELQRNGRNGYRLYGMRYHGHENDDSRLQEGRTVDAKHLMVPMEPLMPRHHGYKIPLKSEDTLAGKIHTGRRHHHNGKRRHHRGRVGLHRLKNSEDLVDIKGQTANSNVQVDGIGIKENPDTM